MSLELCDTIAEEIDRRIVAGFSDLRTSSVVDEASETGNAPTLAVFKVPRRGKWNHFADFTIRCRQTGPGQYDIDVSCNLTLIEVTRERIRFDRVKIEDTLRIPFPRGRRIRNDAVPRRHPAARRGGKRGRSPPLRRVRLPRGERRTKARSCRGWEHH
jgi:hypothetical protein